MSFKNYLYKIHHLELDTLTIFISKQFKLIGEKLTEQCLWTNEVFQKNEERIWLNIFKCHEDELKKDFKQSKDNMGILRTKLSKSEERSIYSVQVDEWKNLEKKENIIKLFRINMRSLIVVKIIMNTIEYFEIYYKTFFYFEDIKLFKNKTTKDIPKDNEHLNEIVNKIKADNNLKDLSEDEELQLYRYILDQNHKNECFGSSDKLFNLLKSLNELFADIEKNILDFYIEFYSDSCSNEEDKKSIHDMLTLEYEEEYLEMAKIIEEYLEFPFLRLPTKLKKLVN